MSTGPAVPVDPAEEQKGNDGAAAGDVIGSGIEGAAQAAASPSPKSPREADADPSAQSGDTPADAAGADTPIADAVDVTFGIIDIVSGLLDGA